ncbi:DUF2243 domain-containing protein [Heyndrickxia camelliae]|uniref:DUF2243 domain-containing protein n=1 Tax=Heyndrickxia camelliae TaxID=1707093 RepID=A0A2N3LE31_9BACI|nr:DUF2243 domain-containing protein [Heyndrickxia camelliae]PKR82794.1 DUF2243 domain-containing protein [Heyndrickxia camelliae]
MNIIKDMRKNGTLFGAFLLGIGLIGMLDGIIFHQILQWHSMYMYTNRFNQIVSDGLFHLLVTIVIFWGALVLWKTSPNDQSSLVFISGLLFGGGLFNFIEGIIDHHILRIHHVKPGLYQDFYDLVFDIVGLAMILIAIALYSIGKRKQIPVAAVR